MSECSLQSALLTEQEAIDLAITRSLKTASFSYYVICKSSKDASLIGVHVGSWKQLSQVLPGHKLCGSGCTDCKRFDDLSEAEHYWALKSKQKDGAAPLHDHRGNEARALAREDSGLEAAAGEGTKTGPLEAAGQAQGKDQDPG